MKTNMRRSLWLSSLLVVACADRPSTGDPTGGETSTTGTAGPESGGPTSGVPTTSGAPDDSTTQPGTVGGTGSETGDGTTGSPNDTGTAETCGTDCDSESGGAVTPCDLFAQDCPEGQKCAPYDGHGGETWNATRCVPVTGDGQPGEPCVAPEGGLGGLDDCAEGNYCWEVDEMGDGHCMEMCSGSEADPMCKGDAHCNITSEGVLSLCFPICDPLAQDCPGDDLCIPVKDTFVCVVDASGAGGQVFDACEFPNACDKGLVCLDPSAGVECDPSAGGCCLPLCDLSKPDAMCPGAGQSCVSLYEPGMAPAKFEDVGVCVVP